MELQGHKGSQKGVGYDTMLGQEVTPQNELCLCIKMDHIYIHMERETLGFHLPLSLHLLILLISIYNIYMDLPNPKDYFSTINKK